MENRKYREYMAPKPNPMAMAPNPTKRGKKVLPLILSIALLTTAIPWAPQNSTFADSVTIPIVTPANQGSEQKLQAGFDQIKVMVEGIKANYYRDVTDEEIVNAMYKGLFDALDPHSTYFTPKEYQDFSSNMSGSITGVGISVAPRDGYLEVIAPIKGTPAYTAGIKPLDLITEVDGKSIKGLTSDVVIGMIRGQVGTRVTLTIQRLGQKTPLKFPLVRAIIDMISVEHKLVDGVDVIALTSWDENTLEQLEKAFKGASLKKGMVIDLRDNPGGLLNQVVAISSLFLKAGQRIVSIDYGKSSDQYFDAPGNGLTVPMVVLINGGSASASEIFAAAMQDHKRAKVVGTKSYGKGTVQGLFNLPDTGAMKLTIASYSTPSGKNIHGIGVNPDVVVENSTEADTTVLGFVPFMSTRAYSRGQTGLEVKAAQQRLTYLGYKLVADGSFGEGTQKALKTFQQKVGLKGTGILDESSKLALAKAALDLGKTKVVDKQMQYALSLLK